MYKPHDRNQYDKGYKYGYKKGAKDFTEQIKEHIAALEYKANTSRKTVPVQTLYDQINWILNEVIPKTIDGALKEMEDNNNV